MHPQKSVCLPPTRDRESYYLRHCSNNQLKSLCCCWSAQQGATTQYLWKRQIGPTSTQYRLSRANVGPTSPVRLNSLSRSAPSGEGINHIMWPKLTWIHRSFNVGTRSHGIAAPFHWWVLFNFTDYPDTGYIRITRIHKLHALLNLHMFRIVCHSEFLCGVSDFHLKLIVKLFALNGPQFEFEIGANLSNRAIWLWSVVNYIQDSSSMAHQPDEVWLIIGRSRRQGRIKHLKKWALLRPLRRGYKDTRGRGRIRGGGVGSARPPFSQKLHKIT